MNEMPVNETESKPQDLAIYIQKQQFADFILNFLGKKEKLKFEDDLSFELNHNDVEQFYYLLNAKIQKEQNIVIEHFLVTILYNDNTKREISGIDSLNKFKETRFVYPTSVNLTWNIIVNFPSSDTVENQTIELAFITNEGYIQEMPLEYRERYAENYKDLNGKIYLNILHTNQAWGIEVLNLIKDKIKACSQIKPRPYNIAKAINKHLNFRSFLVAFALVATLGLYTAIFKLDSFSSTQSNAYYDIASEAAKSNIQDLLVSLIAVQKMEKEDIEKTSKNVIKSVELKKKLLAVSKYSRSKKDGVISTLLNTLLIIIAFATITLYSKYVIKYYGNNSYILLTDRAESIKKSEGESKSKTQYYSLTFITVTIVLGVVVNWITTIIK